MNIKCQMRSMRNHLPRDSGPRRCIAFEWHAKTHTYIQKNNPIVFNCAIKYIHLNQIQSMSYLFICSGRKLWYCIGFMQGFFENTRSSGIIWCLYVHRHHLLNKYITWTLIFIQGRILQTM